MGSAEMSNLSTREKRSRWTIFFYACQCFTQTSCVLYKKIKMADYKKTLAKWAARTGATTRMWREDCAQYVDGKKVGTKTFINVNCDLIPRTVRVEKAADQSVEQAEQACAQKFLKSFASAPVHK